MTQVLVVISQHGLMDSARALTPNTNTLQLQTPQPQIHVQGFRTPQEPPLLNDLTTDNGRYSRPYMKDNPRSPLVM